MRVCPDTYALSQPVITWTAGLAELMGNSTQLTHKTGEESAETAMYSRPK